MITDVIMHSLASFWISGRSEDARGGGHLVFDQVCESINHWLGKDEVVLILPICASTIAKRIGAECNATVDEIVAVRALRNSTKPQLSTTSRQQTQSKSVIFTRFQLASTSSKNWFGTRGSEVQILSPRPFKSIAYRNLLLFKKPTVDDFVAVAASMFNT